MPAKTHPDTLTKVLLGIIAGALTTIAVERVATPPAVEAQSYGQSLYIEPGVKLLRAPDGSKQMYGKVMVDLRNGDIWGFPTYQADSVYPMDSLSAKTPVSVPFKLGRFALDQMNAGQ